MFTSMSENCAPCAAGKFNNANDLTACAGCPAGQYQDETGMTGCKTTQCTAHFTGDSGTGLTAPKCVACASGSDVTRATQTWGGTGPQDASKYQIGAGASRCTIALGVTCPAGHVLKTATTYKESYSGDGLGVTNFKVGSSTYCSPCPVGHKNNAADSATVCDKCGNGQYQDQVGQTTCKAVTCADGSMITAVTSELTSNAAGCALCAAGQYTRHEHTQTACTANTCAKGKYFSSAAGVGEACTPCAAGTYQDAVAQTSCKVCVGKHQLLTGQETCLNTCKAGEYITSGPTECQVCASCAAGQFSTEGAAACTKCAVGQYATDEGQNACKGGACASGKYGLAAGQTALDANNCKNCAAGKYSGAEALQCMLCAVGKFSVEGSTTCTPCADGKTAAAGTAKATADTCSLCAAGKFAVAGDAKGCQNCAVGKWSATTASTCIACGVGTTVAKAVADVGGGTEVGKCLKCAAGKFSASGDAKGCQNCAIGTYSAESSGSCKNCALGLTSGEGTAQATVEADSCATKCAAGTYKAVGPGPCLACAQGKYNDEEQQASCAKTVLCPSGKGQAVVVGAIGAATASDLCKTCAAGMYKPAAGFACLASACAGVLAGKVDGTDPAVAFFHCAVKTGGTNGNCAAETTSAGCTLASTTNGVTGAANACEFNAGANTAIQNCRVCPAGQFGAGTTRVSCAPCAAGTYQNERGAATCKDMSCCLGTFSDETGKMSTKGACKKCAAGKFGDETGKVTSCKACAEGMFADMAGRKACAQMRCSPGQSIKASPKGVANTALAAAKAKSDASSVAADVTATAAAKATADAAPGHAAATSCEACAAGKFVIAGNTIGTSCTSARCVMGKSIAGTGAKHGDDDCATCATGHALGGSAQCKACLNVQIAEGYAATSSNPANKSKNDGTNVNNKTNTIAVDFTLTGWVADDTKVVISGLKHSGTPSNVALPITGDSAAHYGRTGDWNQAAGTLTLTVKDNTLISHDSAKTCKSLNRNMVLNMGGNSGREFTSHVSTKLTCKRGALKAGAVIKGVAAPTCTKAPTTAPNAGTCGAAASTTTLTAGYTACEKKSFTVSIADGGKLTVVMDAAAVTSVTVLAVGTKTDYIPGATITLPKASVGFVDNTFGPAADLVITLADDDLNLCFVGCGATTYKNVASSTTNVGKAATFDVTLDANGLTSLKVHTKGTGYKTNDMVTIDRSVIGAVSGCWAFKAKADVTAGIVFKGTADKECTETPTSSSTCAAYAPAAIKVETALTATTAAGSKGTWTTTTTGITKCTQAATKTDVKGNNGKLASFDFVFSEAKLTAVTVNKVGKGLTVGEKILFTKADLGFMTAVNGPTNSYELTVTAAMLEGVQGPANGLSFVLTEADLECEIPHGDATALMPLGQSTSARTSTTAYMPLAADFRKQSIAVMLANPAGFGGPQAIQVAVSNQGSSIPDVSTASGTGHFSGEPLFTDLKIVDSKSSEATKNSLKTGDSRDLTVDFTVNLVGGGKVVKGSKFVIEGLLTTTAATASFALTGANAATFTAELTQTCSPTKSTLTLTAKADIVPDAADKVGAKMNLKFSLMAPNFGRVGSPVTISSDGTIASGFSNSDHYAIAATAFPAAETKYVLATNMAAVEKVTPSRVLPGTAQVSLSGLTGNEDVGFSSDQCGSITGTASATVSAKYNAGGKTSAAISISTLALGSYNTCIVRPSGKCGKAGDYSTAAVSGAKLTVVKPVLSPLEAARSTVTTFYLPTALPGDIVLFDAGKDCKSTGVIKVTMTEAGQVASPNTLGTTDKTHVCFATKEDPTVFAYLGEVVVFADSLAGTLSLNFKDATGKAVTIAIYDTMTPAVKKQFQEGIRASILTDLLTETGMAGLKLDQIQIDRIYTGSIKVDFVIVGSKAQLEAGATALKSGAVGASLATQAAALLSNLVPGSTFTGTASVTATVKGSTKPPPKTKPTPPPQPTLDGSTPKLTAGATVTPTGTFAVAVLCWVGVGVLG